MASHPSRRGSNFCRFLGLGRRKNNDILGIYFVRNNCVFSDAPEPVQNKIPKKSHFFGEFSRIYFSSRFLFSVMFLHCAFWVVLDVRLAVRKNANAIFSRETIRCFLAPALSLRKRIPYLSANRLEPRISRDQHIQTCQFKTTNGTLISSPLVRWKWPTHVRTLGTLWWG